MTQPQENNNNKKKMQTNIVLGRFSFSWKSTDEMRAVNIN